MAIKLGMNGKMYYLGSGTAPAGELPMPTGFTAARLRPAWWNSVTSATSP
jgi:hypothetical protein